MMQMCEAQGKEGAEIQCMLAALKERRGETFDSLKLHVVMPIPLAGERRLAQHVDFQFTQLVNQERVPPCARSCLDSVSKAPTYTYVHMSFSTVEPSEEDREHWRWIQRELMMKSCAACTKPATHSCAGCGKTAYCSRACQAVHWKHGAHNGVCALLTGKGTPSSAAPGATWSLGPLFDRHCYARFVLGVDGLLTRSD